MMLFFDFLNLTNLIPDSWLPASENILFQGQAMIIIMLCMVLIFATGFLLLSWIISRDLQTNTIVVSIFYIACLVWIAYLPSVGNVFLAGSLLIGLLLITLMFTTIHYGVSSPSVSAFLLPIIVSILILNTTIGFFVTLSTILFIWLTAFAELRGWRTPLLPVNRDNLTFKAPLFTVIFTAVFIMLSGWNNYLINNLG